ncbi:MAG TPA: hypothetical protein PK869_04195 [Candidatus Hydrogenedentes bacterium]|nr:hypothetical protein [Candidatus Hydrogenedentota bacterium]
MNRFALLALTLCSAAHAQDITGVHIDPISRNIQVSYRVPETAPDTVSVYCDWSPAAGGDWVAARVAAFVSETGYNMTSGSDWLTGQSQGGLAERRAAGLTRTVVFNPYPEAMRDGVVKVKFRISITGPGGAVISIEETDIDADFRDVVYLEDWSKVIQHGQLAPEAKAWTFKTNYAPTEGMTHSNALIGYRDAQNELPQLTHPLALSGYYAIYLCTNPTAGAIRMRLSGDERSDQLGSRFAGEEVLWRWARMDRQHLVLRQTHNYTGWQKAHVDYIKLVPLPDATVLELESRFGGAADRLIAGYWEPYSWAFWDNVTDSLQHREPLTAFSEARIKIVDTQIGRFGMKSVFETRLTDQLLYSTIGDPIGDVARPTTDNVGRMQQYTNTLDATIRYTKEMMLVPHANFGATNCYPDSPLQGDFSKQHPEWMRGSALRYEVPEVREYVLGLYREALAIGAPGISIDFCRYPEGIDTKETCTEFLRALRALADEYGKARYRYIPILVRFPGTGVRKAENFDYATWAKEGLVDYLSPSNIQGRHMHIDMTPYIAATKDTSCMLLPCMDALTWGLPFPGPFLWRASQLYNQGVKGVYVYQADGRVLGLPSDKRHMRMLASSGAIARFWHEDAVQRPRHSKRIYITPPHEFGKYHGWERIRIWTEGVALGPVEVYLDDALVTRMEAPPYLVGTEEYASDGVIPTGEHTLKIRAMDGDGWLEQTFTITGA